MQIANYATDLTDTQWGLLEPMLPKPKPTGRPRTCLRRVINALLYINKSGCHWHLLPRDFPPPTTVHGFFRASRTDGTLDAIHSRIRAQARKATGRRSRPTAAILDSQTVRSDGLADEAGYDGAKKTKGRKRFLLVDTIGHALAVSVEPADTPERHGAKALLDEALAQRTLLKRLYVDGGFSGPEFAAHVAKLKPGMVVEVVKRSDAALGFEVVPKRWVVERRFGVSVRRTPWFPEEWGGGDDGGCFPRDACAGVGAVRVRLSGWFRSLVLRG